MTNTGVCPSCGCSQPQGLLCSEDTGKLEAMLAAAPQLIDQLEVAISKQAKVGGGGGKAGQGSAHVKSPINWNPVPVRDALLVQILQWTDIDEVRRHPQAAGILSGVGLCVKNAYRAIDRLADRQYLGKCNHTPVDVACTAEIWAEPGANQAKCRECKYTHNVSFRRSNMLDQAADMICTVREASQYIGSYGDMPITASAIRNWIHRGRLATRPGPTKERHILFGDLLVIVRERFDGKEQRVTAA